MGITEEKNIALNSTIKPAADSLLKLADHFPDGDFMQSFFQNMELGTREFIDQHFDQSEISDQYNLLKKHISHIDQDTAAFLMKLMGIHFTLTFLINEENEELLESFDLGSEMIFDFLADGLGFVKSDIELFNNLIECIHRDASVYTIEWTKALYNKVLQQPGMPMIDEILVTGSILTVTGTAFVSRVGQG